MYPSLVGMYLRPSIGEAPGGGVGEQLVSGKRGISGDVARIYVEITQEHDRLRGHASDRLRRLRLLNCEVVVEPGRVVEVRRRNLQAMAGGQGELN